MRGFEREEREKEEEKRVEYARFVLNDMFLDYRWKNTVNTESHVVYEKVSDETAFVSIGYGCGDGSVQVSVPLKSVGVQYKTRFSSFMEAYNYVEDRITDYEED
jgi:hypothetical protein